MRMSYFQQPLHDRLKWTLGPHHMFNSALVLGIIAVKEPHSAQSHAIVEDLVAYCEMQRKDIWLNEFALAEVKIVELCIKKVDQFRRDRQVGASSTIATRDLPSETPQAGAMPGSNIFPPTESTLTPEDTISSIDGVPEMFNFASTFGGYQWQAPWGDVSAFEPTDLEQWENVLNTITQEQMQFGF